LEELKSYRWNLKTQLCDTSYKAKEEKIAERKRMLELCSQLAQIAPSKELERMFKTNSKKLADYVDIFPATFSKEGENCLCLDGENGHCRRYIWNCQWTLYSRNTTFCAQRNRCVVGSRIVYAASNQIVIDELAAGLRCVYSNCHKRFNHVNPADIDGRFISDSVDSRFCSNFCLNAYLNAMKDAAEKVSALLPNYSNLFLSRNGINGWGYGLIF
jgi:hypothetical protein